MQKRQSQRWRKKGKVSTAEVVKYDGSLKYEYVSQDVPCGAGEDSQVPGSRAIRRSVGSIAIQYSGAQTRATIGRCEVDALSHGVSLLSTSHSYSLSSWVSGIMTLSLYLLIFLSFNFHYTRGFNSNHEVRGSKGDPFHIQTLLPVKYNTIITDSGSFPITETGNCSTKLFQCQISQDGNGGRTLNLIGTMSESLTHVYLLSDLDLVPTTIFFFNDNKWSDASFGSINPTYSTPIVRKVPRNATVVLQCFINRWVPPFSLYTTVNKTMYFSINAIGLIWENKTAEFPHILSVEHAYNGGRLINITVTMNESIDYYTCNNGAYWLTNVIHWEDPVTTTTTATTTTSSTTTSTTTISPKVYITKTTAVDRGDRSVTKPVVQDETESINFGMMAGIVVGIIFGILLIIICSLSLWRYVYKPTDGSAKDTESFKPESNVVTTIPHSLN
nr:hypothetical transcript [Hymenolepis microstoma]